MLLSRFLRSCWATKAFLVRIRSAKSFECISRRCLFKSANSTWFACCVAKALVFGLLVFLPDLGAALLIFLDQAFGLLIHAMQRCHEIFVAFEVVVKLFLEDLDKASFITNDSVIDMCTDDTDISFEKLRVA
jgi:cell division protein FtsW (lipid II flippase)